MRPFPLDVSSISPPDYRSHHIFTALISHAITPIIEAEILIVIDSNIPIVFDGVLGSHTLTSLVSNALSSSHFVPDSHISIWIKVLLKLRSGALHYSETSQIDVQHPD